MSLEARRLERREKFLAAAVSVFGTRSYAESTVTELCREAGLSRRQFYDEFDSREDLLIAAYDMVTSEALQAVREALASLPDDADAAAAAGSAMTAFMTSIALDSRRATTVYVCAVGVSSAVEEHRVQKRAEFATFLRQVVRVHYPDRPRRSPMEQQLRLNAFIGALTAILHGWSTTTGRRPRMSTVSAVLAEILLSTV
ncbi:TetR/AcrR family transcriptional regulator [Williamsia sp. SKLECPSW1]